MKTWVVVKNTDQLGQALALEDDGAGSTAGSTADDVLAAYLAAHPPKGADVVVRVSHAALNPADLHFILHIPTWVPFRRRATPGLDFAGEVVALGPAAPAAAAHQAAPLAVGARVAGCMSVGLVATGHGALAELVTVPAALVARVPAALLDGSKSADAGMAAAVGLLGCAGQTAHLAATDAAVVAALAGTAPSAPSVPSAPSAPAAPAAPARVLINGASGGVGALLIQAAKARGAFVAAVCSAGNAAFVTALGADEAIDYRAHDPLPPYLAAHCAGGAPFDVIFDCVGDQALFSHSPAYLAPAGVLLCLVGGPSQGVVPFVRNKLVPTLLGGTPRTYKILGLAPSGDRARQAAQWVQDGTLTQMPIDAEFSMADVPKAYEKLATKRARGKIIIRVQ